MRVAVDARELCGRPTGVGRYLAGLLDAWTKSERARHHEWTLVAHAPIDGAARWPVTVTVVEGSGGTVWEQITLPRVVRAERPDVFFAPGYTAPLTVAAPVVLTVHDVSFFAHPEGFSFREGTRRRLLTAWSARRARVVITDSQFSRAEIHRHIGIGAGRTRVIPPGLTVPGSRLSAFAADRPLRRDLAVARVASGGGPAPDAPREPMVLFVGSILARRRVDRLIESFGGVVAKVPNARLEIVGENRTPGLDLDALRRRSADADRITIRSYVDDATLDEVYRRASVFAFLSEYEGFGLTPLEALAYGVPPLVLDTPIARETCGDAAGYVSPAATNDDISAALVDLLTNAVRRDAILTSGRAVLARYDWDRAADHTLSVLEEAAGGR